MRQNWSSGQEKKSHGMRIGLTGLVILLAAAGVAGWNLWKKGENMRFAQKLGAGLNLGNSLDATGLRQYHPEAGDLDFEVSWGNPRIEKEQFAAISAAGFRTVRIPVTWQDHMDDQGQISPEFMNRVQEVVDMAMAENLYVIINTQHEEWLNLEVDREAEMVLLLQTVWGQIAETFREYDEHLLFEGMNEPRLRDSEYEWTSGTKELRQLVNRLNHTFVETVRQSGGNNKTRYLLICPYVNLTQRETLQDLEIPEGHILVSVHAYLPYLFCQKEDGTPDWSVENTEDVQEIREAFSCIKEELTQKKVAAILTEFGCKDKNNLRERESWTAFYKQQAKEAQIPYLWWDNGKDYRLLDREKHTWVYPGIAQILTKGT